MSQWNVRSVNHLHEQWEILHDGVRYGWVFWVRSLRHPELTKRRIIDGLNGVHGDRQPPRTWSFGTEGSRGRWALAHNGETVGEIAWDIIPVDDDQVWQDRVLAGLNWVSEQRSMTPPEPAEMRRAS